MKVSALASGSSGNCFYIEDDSKEFGILVDAGISSRRICERLSAVHGVAPEKIAGIFITHEHSDHIRGADVFAREFQIPIFATHKTIKSSFLCSQENLISSIKNTEALSLKNFEISTFKKSHKASDPVFFSVYGKKTKKHVSVITDAGFPCKNIIESVSESDFLFLESNHDEKMLKDGPYPEFLKNWIKSDIGHLSNNQATICVLGNASGKLNHIVLSHLSENNNTPTLAKKTFESLLKERTDLRKTKITLSDRYKPTELVRV
jgi:phosphoribosyl 1,2-cyclic phosphodiesterase